MEKKLDFFTKEDFLGHQFMVLQDAQKIADICNQVLDRQSFPMFGSRDGNGYASFSSKQGLDDTHVLLAYYPRRLRRRYYATAGESGKT